MHGQTVFIKQRGGSDKRSWNRHVSNCDFLLLGYHHMGWSSSSHSEESKRRRYHGRSHQHFLWSNVRKKLTCFSSQGAEKTSLDLKLTLLRFDFRAITYAAPDLQIFNQAKAAGSEVFKVIQRKPVIGYEYEGKTLEKVEGSIDIQNVYFSYPSRPEKLILQGFWLSIPAGKTVALVGSSGCGKSTIISLVARFYDPSKGLRLQVFFFYNSFLVIEVVLLVVFSCFFPGTVQPNLQV